MAGRQARRPRRPAGRHGGRAAPADGGPARRAARWAGGRMGGMMMPAEKAHELPRHLPAVPRRACGRSAREIAFVPSWRFVSTAGTVFGPKILGNGINKLMDGLVGKTWPVPARRHDPRPGRRSAPRRATAPWPTWWPARNAVPGVGVDFAALGEVLLGLRRALPCRDRLRPGSPGTRWPAFPSGPSTGCAATWT